MIFLISSSVAILPFSQTKYCFIKPCLDFFISYQLNVMSLKNILSSFSFQRPISIVSLRKICRPDKAIFGLSQYPGMLIYFFNSEQIQLHGEEAIIIDYLRNRFISLSQKICLYQVGQINIIAHISTGSFPSSIILISFFLPIALPPYPCSVLKMQFAKVYCLMLNRKEENLVTQGKCHTVSSFPGRSTQVPCSYLIDQSSLRSNTSDDGQIQLFPRII